MSTIGVSTVVAAIAALTLSALPVAAQEGRRGDGDRQGQSRAERRRPRSDSGGQRREGGRAQADRGSDNNERAVPRRESVPRADVDGRNSGRDRDRNQRRRAEPQRGSRDSGRYLGRRDNGRYLPPSYASRGYSGRSRVYVVPYGYRPRGYRPGWNLNLYFGRPNHYRSPGYYGSRNYGYYALPAGFAYGSLRIVDAPRHAPVFVDGYYAGEVDDYDGVFQRLNLEPGQHQIEVDAYPGAPPMEFDVYIVPGRTVTIHARP